MQSHFVLVRVLVCTVPLALRGVNFYWFGDRGVLRKRLTGNFRKRLKINVCVFFFKKKKS